MAYINNQKLIEALEFQMPKLVAAIEKRDFTLAAELMTQRSDLLSQLTNSKDMTPAQRDHIHALCDKITIQHEQWLDELTIQHQALADELKTFSARHKAIEQYKNNR